MKAIAIAALLVAGCHHPVQSPDAPPSVLGHVLVIGDSISLGYTPLVIEQLPTVEHMPSWADTVAAAIQPGVIDGWLGATQWSAIHFNWGLHDIAIASGSGTSAVLRVPPDVYLADMRIAVARLKQTGARLIWANTTPVPTPDQVPCSTGCRRNSDVLYYNNLAAEVMTENDVEIEDLYAVVASDPADYAMQIDVHLTQAGYAALASQVVFTLEKPQ